MKYRNTLTVALVSLAIFFAFAVAGGICLGAGFGEYAKNSDMINNFSGFVEYVEEYADVFDDNDFSISAQRSEAHYVRELDAELTSIVIDASGGAVTVDVGATEEFRVDFDGNVKSGSYDVFDEYTQPVVSGDVVVDYADYYAHSGIIEVRLKGDTLHISFDSALGVSIKPGFVNIGGNNSRISVTLPASYNGSLEIKNCVEDTVLRGCKLENRKGLAAVPDSVEHISGCHDRTAVDVDAHIGVYSGVAAESARLCVNAAAVDDEPAV